MSGRGKPAGRKRKAQTKLPENQETRVNKTPPGGHVFLPIQTIFELNCKKTAPPPGGHVFPPIMTIFELIRDIYKIDAKNVTSRVFTSFFLLFKYKGNDSPHGGHKTHVLTKFHEDWTKNKTAPPPGGHVFSPIGTIFELFHNDWAKIVTSRVFTRKTAPPPGGHVFQRTRTIF
ncbi:hypothetical protein DPMN_018343 [Dreissena polymorpha]|uniref:Uncharacterized protein n=1 Tax=Dreissena polymorpha TaxID=45954 RepID=A0A9D4NGE0_DREPO|nr:hypothetical protein DPMN_018343 [Dreissena polymorpha]